MQYRRHEQRGRQCKRQRSDLERRVQAPCDNEPPSANAEATTGSADTKAVAAATNAEAARSDPNSEAGSACAARPQTAFGSA